MSDELRDELRELIEDWRENADRAMSCEAPTTAMNLDHCADQLERVLDDE